jgi:hypothetical protein
VAVTLGKWEGTVASRKLATSLLLLPVPVVAVVVGAVGAHVLQEMPGRDGTPSPQSSLAPVTVAQLGAAPSAMAPGGPARPINFTIHNPESEPQYVVGATVSIHAIRHSTGRQGPADCSPENYALVQPTAITAHVPGGDTVFSPSGATIRMVERGTNQDNCKNVTVYLDFVAR